MRRKEWVIPILAAVIGSLISISVVWAGFWQQIPTRTEVRTMIEDVSGKQWLEKLINKNTDAIVLLTKEVQTLRVFIAKMDENSEISTN